jgi:nucleotide-binding universal stress UspA family protein
MAVDIARGPVLIGVDGSEPSVAALRYAGKLAEAMNAPLRVVIAWEFPDFGVAYPGDDWEPDVRAAAVLSAAITQAFGDDLPPRLRKDVLEGQAASILIEESRHARMLVVGARGAGGFARLLLGSVSEACARHAACPVLVVRTPAPETPTARHTMAERRTEPMNIRA